MNKVVYALICALSMCIVVECSRIDIVAVHMTGQILPTYEHVGLLVTFVNRVHTGTPVEPCMGVLRMSFSTNVRNTV